MSDIIYRIKRKYKNQNDFELFRLNKNKKLNKITRIRDFGFLNKFRIGVKITNIKPIKLLIKNRG